MANVAEAASDLKKQRERLRYQKENINQELEEIESQLELPDISQEEKEDLIQRKRDLEDELENISEAIAAAEVELRDLIGDAHDQDTLSNVADKAKSLIEELEDERAKIEDKQESFEETLDSLNESQDEITELEETAKGLLKRTTSSALGQEFTKRKSELEENLKYWKGASVFSIVLLLLSSGAIYADIIRSDSAAITNLSKIALILPISVAVWFSVSNYSRQKKLMEEYEFKSRVALSLPGFREVLEEEAPDEEIVAEFVTDSMEKIYSNPQKNIQSNTQEDDQSDPLTTGQKPLVEVIKRLGK